MRTMVAQLLRKSLDNWGALGRVLGSSGASWGALGNVLGSSGASWGALDFAVPVRPQMLPQPLVRSPRLLVDSLQPTGIVFLFDIFYKSTRIVSSSLLCRLHGEDRFDINWPHMEVRLAEAGAIAGAFPVEGPPFHRRLPLARILFLALLHTLGSGVRFLSPSFDSGTRNFAHHLFSTSAHQRPFPRRLPLAGVLIRALLRTLGSGVRFLAPSFDSGTRNFAHHLTH